MFEILKRTYFSEIIFIVYGMNLIREHDLLSLRPDKQLKTTRFLSHNVLAANKNKRTIQHDNIIEQQNKKTTNSEH